MTLPVVGAHIGVISKVFYEKLFAAVPSLRTNLFNGTNQANLTQQQALASSVASFATMLVMQEPRDIDAIMARIAAKHASLGVTSDLYEVVRTHLFAAIVEVLGDAVTPQVAAAWDEVYTLMANSLAEQESQLYQDVGVTEGQVWSRPWWPRASTTAHTPQRCSCVLSTGARSASTALASTPRSASASQTNQNRSASTR